MKGRARRKNGTPSHSVLCRETCQLESSRRWKARRWLASQTKLALPSPRPDGIRHSNGGRRATTRWYGSSAAADSAAPKRRNELTAHERVPGGRRSYHLSHV